MAAINKLSDKKLKLELGKAREKEASISDGGGLNARISKMGVICWQYRYREGGRGSKAISVKLGTYPTTSLKEAREKRDQCRNWLENSKDPRTELKLVSENRVAPVTVRDALEYWIEKYAKSNRKNWDKTSSQFNRHIYPYIGELPLDRVDTSLWVDCFDRITLGIKGKRNPAPKASAYILQSAKQALKFCRVRKYAISFALDDLVGTDIGEKQQDRDRFLSEKEIHDVLMFIENGRTLKYYRDMLKLLLIFGSRTREIRLSTWREWDFQRNVWTVPKEHSKNGKEIVRTIPEALLPWVLELKGESEPSDLILGVLKEPYAVSQQGRNYWKRLKHDEKWTLHDLRRTLTTKMNDLGVPPHVVEQITGHTLPGVMKIYNHSQYIPEKRKAFDKWLGYLEKLKNPDFNVLDFQDKRIV